MSFLLGFPIFRGHVKLRGGGNICLVSQREMKKSGVWKFLLGISGPTNFLLLKKTMVVGMLKNTQMNKKKWPKFQNCSQKKNGGDGPQTWRTNQQTLTKPCTKSTFERQTLQAWKQKKNTHQTVHHKKKRSLESS